MGPYRAHGYIGGLSLQLDEMVSGRRTSETGVCGLVLPRLCVDPVLRSHSWEMTPEERSRAREEGTKEEGVQE